jgi:hypothetical protein
MPFGTPASRSTFPNSGPSFFTRPRAAAAGAFCGLPFSTASDAPATARIGRSVSFRTLSTGAVTAACRRRWRALASSKRAASARPAGVGAMRSGPLRASAALARRVSAADGPTAPARMFPVSTFGRRPVARGARPGAVRTGLRTAAGVLASPVRPCGPNTPPAGVTRFFGGGLRFFAGLRPDAIGRPCGPRVVATTQPPVCCAMPCRTTSNSRCVCVCVRGP